MPCKDYPSNGTFYEDPAQRLRADKLARIACELAKYIESTKTSVIAPIFSWETELWWIEHKEADRKRQEAEAKARRIRKIKKDAIKKLTPEERKALGL